MEDLTDGTEGYSLEKGMWQSHGWQELEELRKRLQNMKDLRDLIRRLSEHRPFFVIVKSTPVYFPIFIIRAALAEAVGGVPCGGLRGNAGAKDSLLAS